MKDSHKTEIADKELEYEGRDLEAMSLASNYRKWILGAFTDKLRGSVLEIGAGQGNNTADISKLPAVTQTIAIEPSNNMFAALKERAIALDSVTALQGTLASTFPHIPNDLDTVMYINVLEHIEDHRSELLLACRALKPGGYLLVFVPALPWLYSEFDRSIGHHRRYTKGALKELAEKAGFASESARYLDFAGVFSWFITLKLLRGSISPLMVNIYDKLVVPIMRPLEALQPPPIGKSLVLIARKI